MTFLDVISLVCILFYINTLCVKGQNSSEPTCFQAGECTQSLFIGDWHVTDAQSCLVECQNDEDCLYFSFFENDGLCDGFANCEVFQEHSCTNCYSGESSCEDLQCWIQGRCQGILIDEVPVETSNECMDLCKSNTDCFWFTYNSLDSGCTLLQDCQQLDSACTSCVTGQRQCSARKDFTKLLVIGGYNNDIGADISNVEVIDLENASNACNPINDYPIEDTGMTLGIIDGLLKSCGSYHDSDDCYDYNPATNSWITSASLLNSRASPKSSFIGDTWLVTGDGSTIEMWTGSGFEQGPSMPFYMSEHCQLTVNSTHIFFGPGEIGAPSYLLDWYSQTWTSLPPYMYIEADDDIGIFCGLINNPQNGFEAVVTWATQSQIFNFNNLSWRPLTSPTPHLHYAGVAQLIDTFVIVGGGSNSGTGTSFDTIYEFDHLNYGWILKSQHLQIPRNTYPGVVAVPDEFVLC